MDGCVGEEGLKIGEGGGVGRCVCGGGGKDLQTEHQRSGTVKATDVWRTVRGAPHFPGPSLQLRGAIRSCHAEALSLPSGAWKKQD